jgi:ABC-type Zn uptake system ZnuABC Zn-binding protein ZnuA
MMWPLAALLVALGGPLDSVSHARGPVQDEPVIVTSLTTYAAIAREIVGERGEVSAIADGAENPHFVMPRPSLILQLRKADMFVVTGLDLELWVPVLIDRANNAEVRPGGRGYVRAVDGIALLDVPTSVSRAGGDIHVFGNPHIWTSPVNAVVIGRNILVGLKRISPENAQYYEARYEAWKEKVVRALAGEEIVDLLGADAVIKLARDNRLVGFLESESYQGRPLVDRLGGWLKQGAPFRGRRMVCYHKEWDYFGRVFDVACEAYVESKPGIPPAPRHVAELIGLMREQDIPVLFSTNYFDRKQVESVADRTGAAAVIVPSNTEGAPEIHTYIELVDLWVRELATAFEGER